MIFAATYLNIDRDEDASVTRWATKEDHFAASTRQSPERRHYFLLGRACLRALLHEATGKSDWTIALAPSGKPYLLPADKVSTPYISISHTKGLVACAVSFYHIIGIDAEYWRQRDFCALASYAFGPREAEIVVRHGAAAFYRLWTLKEAIAKVQGTSIFSILKKKDDLSEITEAKEIIKESWQLFYDQPLPNYSLALALQRNGDEALQAISWIELSGDGDPRKQL